MPHLYKEFRTTRLVAIYILTLIVAYALQSSGFTALVLGLTLQAPSSQAPESMRTRGGHRPGILLLHLQNLKPKPHSPPRKTSKRQDGFSDVVSEQGALRASYTLNPKAEIRILKQAQNPKP